jgi:hypothetical protein
MDGWDLRFLVRLSTQARRAAASPVAVSGPVKVVTSAEARAAERTARARVVNCMVAEVEVVFG